jgi:hypothetical protein
MSAARCAHTAAALGSSEVLRNPCRGGTAPLPDLAEAREEGRRVDELGHAEPPADRIKGIKGRDEVGGEEDRLALAEEADAEGRGGLGRSDRLTITSTSLKRRFSCAVATSARNRLV